MAIQFERKEFRTSNKGPHEYGYGSRLSSAYTAGLNGQPAAKHFGGPSSAAHTAWKRGKAERDSWSAIMRRLNDAGFTVFPTGGGCTGWYKSFGDKTYALVTSRDDATHDIREEGCVVGIYNEAGDEIACSTEWR